MDNWKRNYQKWLEELYDDNDNTLIYKSYERN